MEPVLNQEMLNPSEETTKDPEAQQFIQNLLDTIQTALDEKKAENVETIKVAGRTSLTDYFVIATARSSTHCKVLSDAVEEAVSQNLGQQVRQVEGMEKRKWIVLDYGDIVVHVMRQEDREFYNLERLWKGSTSAK